MIWSTLLFVLGLLTLATVLRPLWGPPELWEPEAIDSEGLRALRRQKSRLMRFLKDLELERATETLDETEYQELWDQYAREVALIQQRLSALEPRAESTTNKKPLPNDPDESE